MKVRIRGKEFEVADEPRDYWGWVASGNYDREWLTYDQYLRPEHTFIDVGAWIGSHSLYASSVAKAVHAIEPDPVAVGILTENTKNHKITVCIGAICGHEGRVEIGSGYLGASTTRMNLAAGGGIGAAVPEHTVTVDCTTLRKYVDEWMLPRPSDPLFIKLDVEGAEEEIMRDLEFFQQHKPTLLVELHPWWWTNPEEGWKTFEALKALYHEQHEVSHNTWLLARAH